MDDLGRVRQALDEHGLLPVQDHRVPSVCTLVAGEPVRGSWWGHPAGHRIFDVLGRVDDDAAAPKLLWGKITLVHRRLWAALAAVGEEEAAWKERGLDATARDLLDAVRAAGEVRSDALGKGIGKPLTLLEQRLLLVSEQMHSEEGHHVRILRTWQRWHPELGRPSAGDARATLDAAAEALGARAGLPWIA